MATKEKLGGAGVTWNPASLQAKRKGVNEQIRDGINTACQYSALRLKANWNRRTGTRYGPDTGTIGVSFYAGRGNKNAREAHTKAVNRMRPLYLSKYSAEHFAERVANVPDLLPSQCVVGSASLVFAYWEYGHHNKITGKNEHVPILRQEELDMKADIIRNINNNIRKYNAKRGKDVKGF